MRGQGHFTADLASAHWVRFVRSPVASGRIGKIKLPPGASVFTGRDLQGVKPIKPMLHKFNYVPISQPVLATNVVRFVGEPVAAVVAATAQEAEDLADLVEVEIETLPAVIDAPAALDVGAKRRFIGGRHPASLATEQPSRNERVDAAVHPE